MPRRLVGGEAEERSVDPQGDRLAGAVQPLLELDAQRHATEPVQERSRVVGHRLRGPPALEQGPELADVGGQLRPDASTIGRDRPGRPPADLRQRHGLALHGVPRLRPEQFGDVPARLGALDGEEGEQEQGLGTLERGALEAEATQGTDPHDGPMLPTVRRRARRRACMRRPVDTSASGTTFGPLRQRR
jgi:hypothetical protein